MGRETWSRLNTTFSLRIWHARRKRWGEAAFKAFWSPWTNAPRTYPAGRTNPTPAVRMAYFWAMPSPTMTLGGFPALTGLNTIRFKKTMYTDVKSAKAMSRMGTSPLEVSTKISPVTCSCSKEKEPMIPCFACRCSAAACTHWNFCTWFPLAVQQPDLLFMEMMSWRKKNPNSIAKTCFEKPKYAIISYFIPASSASCI